MAVYQRGFWREGLGRAQDNDYYYYPALALPN